MYPKIMKYIFKENDIVDILKELDPYNEYVKEFKSILRTGTNVTDILSIIMLKFCSGIRVETNIDLDKSKLPHDFYMTLDVTEDTIDLSVELPTSNFTLGFCNFLRGVLKNILSKTLSSSCYPEEKNVGYVIKNQISYRVFNTGKALMFVRYV